MRRARYIQTYTDIFTIRQEGDDFKVWNMIVGALGLNTEFEIRFSLDYSTAS